METEEKLDAQVALMHLLYRLNITRKYVYKAYLGGRGGPFLQAIDVTDEITAKMTKLFYDSYQRSNR